MSSAIPPNTIPWNEIGSFAVKSFTLTQTIVSPLAIVSVASTSIECDPVLITPDPWKNVAL